MAKELKTARLTDATPGNQIDNAMSALEQAVGEILGLPLDTELLAALLVVTAAGLQAVVFQDAAANPATAGHLQRNGTRLKYHDGSAVRQVVHDGDIAAPSNAHGVRTVSTSAPSGGSDGDLWFRY